MSREGSLFDLSLVELFPFDDPLPLEDLLSPEGARSPTGSFPLEDPLSSRDPPSPEGLLPLEGLGLGTDRKTTAKTINEEHAALKASLMAQPLDITPHLLSSLHLVRDGTVKIPLNLAWALDVKRVIDQRVLNTRKVPPDSMARRILIAHSCIEFWGNKKQPEEHRDRRQSNDTPRNQIGLLRQLCFLSLVEELASISPKGHLDCF